MLKPRYVIEDWAGNHLFKDKEFDSFEDGWEFIQENVDNSLYFKTNNEDDNAWQEYFVIPKTSRHE